MGSYKYYFNFITMRMYRQTRNVRDWGKCVYTSHQCELYSSRKKSILRFNKSLITIVAHSIIASIILYCVCVSTIISIILFYAMKTVSKKKTFYRVKRIVPFLYSLVGSYYNNIMYTIIIINGPHDSHRLLLGLNSSNTFSQLVYTHFSNVQTIKFHHRYQRLCIEGEKIT